MERAAIYKILKVLHHEPIEDEFQQCLNGFEELLSSNTIYGDFKTYFDDNYLKRTEQWATCYRLRCIGTNNFIESFHSTFKKKYLRGKVNNRVDKCIHALLKYARDYIFKRARKLSKQAYPINHNMIVSRHKAAKTMDVAIVELDNKCWRVDSQTEEGKSYTVEFVNEICPYDCKLTCRDCKTCPHIYECDCVDYLVGLNICKHIHRLILTQINIEIESQTTAHTEQVIELNEYVVAPQEVEKSIKDELLQNLDILRSSITNPLFKQDENEMVKLNTLLKNRLPLYTQAVEGRPREPANKAAQKQLCFYSNKKRKAQTTPRLGNPDVGETLQIKKSLKD